jgi:hypothetical protein
MPELSPENRGLVDLYECELLDVLDAIADEARLDEAAETWTVELSSGHWRCLNAYLTATLAARQEAQPQAGEGETLTAARDEAIRDRNAHAEHVRRMAAECEDGLAALELIDRCWEAYGDPNNRGHLSLDEQIAATLRELDDALHPPEPAGGDELEGLINRADAVKRMQLQQPGSLRTAQTAIDWINEAISNLRALRAISTPPASQEGEDLERSQGSGDVASTPRFAREKAQGEP